MNPNVLIFFPHPLREHHGGPYSYLFHLKEGLKNQDHSVCFLSDQIPQFTESIPTEEIQSPRVKKIIKSVIPQKWINNTKAENWFKELAAAKMEITADYINRFDILHFHESIDIWRYRDLLETYKGKILFTSHTPKPYHLELIEDVWKISSDALDENLFQQLEEIDRFAFQKADTFIFPCKEAIGSYSAVWQMFSAILKQKQIFYLPTGIKKQIPTESVQDIRHRVNIPSNGFVFCFAGRKSPVKGYDLFISAARSLLEQNSNSYFLIAGRKEQTPAIKNERWIETGWTDNPQDYIAASDLLVVPNRHTYFDLSVLEALSLGKPMLLSNTGGNTYFKQFYSPAIFFHEPDADSLLNEMKKCITLNEKTDGSENEKIYTQHFRCEQFAAGMLTVYNTLK